MRYGFSNYPFFDTNIRPGISGNVMKTTRLSGDLDALTSSRQGLLPVLSQSPITQGRNSRGSADLRGVGLCLRDCHRERDEDHPNCTGTGGPGARNVFIAERAFAASRHRCWQTPSRTT